MCPLPEVNFLHFSGITINLILFIIGNTLMQALINFINKFTVLGKEAGAALQQYAEPEFFRKNEFILREGAYCTKVYFIKSGMLRNYFLHDGNEITKWIFCENEMLTSMASYFSGTPSGEYIQACEDTQLISMTKENSHKLNEYPAFCDFSKNLLEAQFARIDNLSKQFSLLGAREKYAMLNELAPEVIKRAKLGHIASLMGITRETLSRIRAK